MKKIFVYMLMYIIGCGIGLLFNPKLHMPEEKKISDYNWISRYDLYDYEEAVLKNGDRHKLISIISEAGVERFPYMIIAYDVHKKDVRTELLQMYIVYSRSNYVHKSPAMTPLWTFVENVLTEYEKKGNKYSVSGGNIERLNEFRKYEP